MSAVIATIRAEQTRYLHQLSELLRLPSVSTDASKKAEIVRTAEWMKARLLSAGCTTAEVIATDGHPIVYGEWLGAPGKPTLLVYGHYDVQPAEPLDKWISPPFEPTIRDGRIYARGASDDKGQVVIHINALEAHLKTHGSVPVNLKFLIEGEEEIGSPSLPAFVAANQQRLRCDAVVVSDTAMFSKDQPSITYGLRGLVYLQVDLFGTHGDLHSGSFGGAVVNPAMALAWLLGKLKDEKGKIKVPGFYDNVVKLTAAERRAFKSLKHSDAKFKRDLGAPELFGEAGFTTLERIWARPTLDINGLWAGFTGQGAKTVIPAEAHAKLSMRLVPNQTPAEITKKVTQAIKKLAPKSVRVEVQNLHGGDGWLAPTEHPALAAASRAVKQAFGKTPVFVREGGSIPIVANFARVLKVPCVLLGVGLNDDNLHAPNEKLDLDNFHKGIEAAALFMQEFGAQKGA